MIMNIPHDRLLDYFRMGSQGLAAVSTLYTLYHQYKRNSVVHFDWKDHKLFDPSYEHYIPVEKVLDKAVPPHCKRVLFVDEFGRTRSKVICGNIQDKSGQRIYYNN